jgi:hypothetical protein
MAPHAISVSWQRGGIDGAAHTVCLLADQLGIELWRVGSAKRMIFGPRQPTVSEWMSRNAVVAFHVCEKA